MSYVEPYGGSSNMSYVEPYGGSALKNSPEMQKIQKMPQG